jgi:SOS-response transcriptional repressor LexA
MSTSATTVQSRLSKYLVVQAVIPGQGLLNLGVLLEDPESNSLRLRFRRDLDALAPLAIQDDQDLDVLNVLADDIAAKARELGAEKLFEYLESNVSNAVRVTDRQEVLVEDFGRALDRLYRQNVQSNVLEFRTHLPRYSLRAAAGEFLENREVTAEGWVEAPEDLLLGRDMFVAEIAGRSMEPRIPDGSLCVFRYGVVGSRIGRLVLAEERGASGNDRYAVKRYYRDPEETERKITLQSLNHEFPDWPLEPDEEKYRVIAEFVRLLD